MNKLLFYNSGFACSIRAMPTLAEIQKQIQALPDRYLFYTSKEVRYLPEILGDNERILAITSGFMQKTTWLCVCTNARVLFLDRGMFWGLRQVQMNLDRIQSIDSSYGLVFGVIRMWDGAASIAISMVLRRSIPPFVKTVQQAMDHYKRHMVHDLMSNAQRAKDSPRTVAGEPHHPSDMLDELERLASLHASGALTDEEFSLAKKKLLQSA